MTFIIRVFAWLLPNNHPLYLEFDISMNNIFISDLITLLSDYSLCSDVNITPHVIQKVFNIVDTSPNTTNNILSSTYLHIDNKFIA